jgi:hypothetical protein
MVEIRFETGEKYRIMDPSETWEGIGLEELTYLGREKQVDYFLDKSGRFVKIDPKMICDFSEEDKAFSVSSICVIPRGCLTEPQRSTIGKLGVEL